VIAALRILAVAVILSSSVSPGPRAETARPARPKFLSIVSFCKVHGTVDYPPEKGFGDPENENLPPLLSQTDANRWRCLDGKVLVCADSADGDQCARKADDRHPAIVAEVCRDGHEGEEVPFYAGHPYRYDWVCRHGRAVIVRSYPLDRRGFFLKAWAPLVVKNGVVVSPKESPGIVR
jgi:hypothetical protein